MGLMEPGCNLEDFGRPVQPAATNRLRCRVNIVSERYLVSNSFRCDGVRVWPMRGVLFVKINAYFANLVLIVLVFVVF
jgi:hypothetical protein